MITQEQKELLTKNFSRLSGRRIFSITNNYSGILETFEVLDSGDIRCTIRDNNDILYITICGDVLIEDD